MAPEFAGDLYDDALLRDPYPAYRQIRDLGPAVWMPRWQLWAVARFAEVRQALRAADTLISGKGVAANEPVNHAPPPITLASDGETHHRRRRVLIEPVMPPALKTLRPRLEDEADRLVAGLADGQGFDAMPRFAAHLPVTVVAELVGLNEAGRQHMLRWAAATFDALGVLNTRGQAALPVLFDLARYIQTLSRDTVAPGGWAARLFDAAERGELSREEANAMVIDYVAPALDTTILATGHMVWQLARHPAALAAVRDTPALIEGVVNESVRLASPIRGFTRYAAEDVELGDAVIPKGARALILYASANRDERRYDDPDRFDITRNPRDHVGWGHGPHACVGMHLARLEMEILLAALARRVERIDIGEPVPTYNNVLQGFERLPAVFHPRNGAPQ